MQLEALKTVFPHLSADDYAIVMQCTEFYATEVKIINIASRALEGLSAIMQRSLWEEAKKILVKASRADASGLSVCEFFLRYLTTERAITLNEPIRLINNFPKLQYYTPRELALGAQAGDGTVFYPEPAYPEVSKEIEALLEEHRIFDEKVRFSLPSKPPAVVLPYPDQLTYDDFYREMYASIEEHGDELVLKRQKLRDVLFSKRAAFKKMQERIDREINYLINSFREVLGLEKLPSKEGLHACRYKQFISDLQTYEQQFQETSAILERIQLRDYIQYQLYLYVNEIEEALELRTEIVALLESLHQKFKLLAGKITQPKPENSFLKMRLNTLRIEESVRGSHLIDILPSIRTWKYELSKTDLKLNKLNFSLQLKV